MPEPTLRDLLPERLGKRPTKAELGLLDAAQKGEFLNLLSGNSEVDDPAKAESWGRERTIRAEFLRWICTDKKASAFIDAKGIRIIGARIEGQLDFEGATISHRLFLGLCSIKGGIIFRDAVTRSINLHGTHTGLIAADRLTVEGSLYLRLGFKAIGGINLVGVKVGGDFDCFGGNFDNENGDALSADGIETKGHIFLRGGFSAKGAVRLIGAKVGGNFECSNGSFLNENGIALYADGIETKGDIFFNDSFSAKGTVRLVGAKVGGQISCAWGSFINENGDALCADGVETKGSIFFNYGFSAKGTVRLPGAKVGSDLTCLGGSFVNVNENGYALLAQRMIVGGDFHWKLKKSPVGKIDLRHAKVGVLTDDKKSWPKPGKLRIDGFEYGAFAPDNTPKKGQDRLEWIELQLPPAFAIPILEPIKNKYIFKWIWKKHQRRIDRGWQSIFKPKPYGNFSNRPSFEFMPQPYEQLAKVLKNMGHESDSREVLIAKQEALRKTGDISWWRKRWHGFLGFTMGHGYRPIKPLLFMIGMVLLGWGLFYLADGYSCMAKSKMSLFKDNIKQYPEFNALIYSLDSFIPFVDLHQENYWIPANNITHIYLWIHIILGWFATTLAAVSLSGVVRKKD